MDATVAEQLELDLFTGYPVKIEIFEGPIDLLVYLVRREELDISEVCLAEVTGQYLEYLQAMQAVNIAVAGEFIVTAATLLQIKSRHLLPVTAQEVEADEDEELELLGRMRRRMTQYLAFKEAAQVLDKSRQQRQHLYVRSLSGEEDLPSGFVRLEDISIFDLVGAVQNLLEEADADQAVRSVLRPPVTLPERIEEVLFQLRAVGEEPLNFTQLVGTPVTRQIIVITFLAVLELIRRRRIRVHEQAAGAEILIRLITEAKGSGESTVEAD